MPTFSSKGKAYLKCLGGKARVKKISSLPGESPSHSPPTLCLRSDLLSASLHASSLSSAPPGSRQGCSSGRGQVPLQGPLLGPLLGPLGSSPSPLMSHLSSPLWSTSLFTTAFLVSLASGRSKDSWGERESNPGVGLSIISIICVYCCCVSICVCSACVLVGGCVYVCMRFRDRAL